MTEMKACCYRFMSYYFITWMFANVGQTLQRVLVDTTVPSFSHGHTYVALSRTPTRKAFHMWFKTIDASSTEAHITNVVYKDLLLPENFTEMGGVVTGNDYIIEEDGYSSMDSEV